jgi:hypothetical protein
VNAQALRNRIITRLRAVVVLPTRDLALQVEAVFKPLCEPLGLKVGLAIGKQNFQAEQVCSDSDSEYFFLVLTLCIVTRTSLLHHASRPYASRFPDGYCWRAHASLHS